MIKIFLLRNKTSRNTDSRLKNQKALFIPEGNCFTSLLLLSVQRGRKEPQQDKTKHTNMKIQLNKNKK